MYLSYILNVITLSSIMIIEYTMLNYKICIVIYLRSFHYFDNNEVLNVYAIPP